MNLGDAFAKSGIDTERLMREVEKSIGRKTPAPAADARISLAGRPKAPATRRMGFETAVGIVRAALEAAIARAGVADATALADSIGSSVDFPMEDPRGHLSRMMGWMGKMGILGVGQEEGGTRVKRLLASLRELPAVHGEGWVKWTRGKSPSLIPTESARDASSYSEVFDVPEDVLSRIGLSRTTPEKNIRDQRMREERATVPDFGLLMIVTAIEVEPMVEPSQMVQHHHAAQICTLLDEYRRMLKATSVERRLKLVGGLMEPAPVAAALAVLEEEPRQRGGASAVPRAVRSVMPDLDAAEESLLEAVDVLVAAFRPQPKPVSRTAERPNAKRPTRIEDGPSSKRTMGEVYETIREAGGITLEIDIPMMRGPTLGISRKDRQERLAAADLAGPRVFKETPGLVYEAVLGPVPHLMDIGREQPDLDAVLVAPRRVGGLGLDLAEARWIPVSDYTEHYVKYVPALHGF
jgi:hypothetical protein